MPRPAAVTGRQELSGSCTVDPISKFQGAGPPECLSEGLVPSWLVIGANVESNVGKISDFSFAWAAWQDRTGCPILPVALRSTEAVSTNREIKEPRG